MPPESLPGFRSRWPLVDRLCLMAGCLPRTPFRELVRVAAGVGFDAVTCWPNMWRHAQRVQGLTLPDMRRLLDDHGLVVTEVEACDDWVATPPAGMVSRRPPPPRAEYLEVCTALGARTLLAAHAIGASVVTTEDIAGFALLCDDAARRGLRVALEYVPFTGVPDLPTALRVLHEIARPNAGLVVDVAHHARSGGRPDDLRSLRPELVFTIQLADGGSDTPTDLLDEAMFHRRLPGDGELPISADLRALAEIGVRATVGPEIFRPGTNESTAHEIVGELYASTVKLLDQTCRT